MTTVYIYESLLIALVVLLVANYFKGKAANRSLAARWAKANLQLFESQFTVVRKW